MSVWNKKFHVMFRSFFFFFFFLSFSSPTKTSIYLWQQQLLSEFLRKPKQSKTKQKTILRHFLNFFQWDQTFIQCLNLMESHVSVFRVGPNVLLSLGFVSSLFSSLPFRPLWGWPAWSPHVPPPQPTPSNPATPIWNLDNRLVFNWFS